VKTRDTEETNPENAPEEAEAIEIRAPTEYLGTLTARDDLSVEDESDNHEVNSTAETPKHDFTEMSCNLKFTAMRVRAVDPVDGPFHVEIIVLSVGVLAVQAINLIDVPSCALEMVTARELPLL